MINLTTCLQIPDHLFIPEYFIYLRSGISRFQNTTDRGIDKKEVNGQCVNRAKCSEGK